MNEKQNNMMLMGQLIEKKTLLSVNVNLPNYCVI